MDNTQQEKRLRSTTGRITVTIPLRSMNIREKVGTTTFDTVIDYLRYIDNGHLWNLFEFDKPRSNCQFKRTFLWKKNALTNIKEWNEENNIRLKEDIVRDIDKRIEKFSQSFKRLDSMFVNDVWVNNNHDLEKFKKIRAKINTIIRQTSQKRMLFCIKAKESKHFIDLIYDGLFSGKKWLEYIDNEFDLYNIIDQAVSNDDYDIDDEPPPLSSSSSDNENSSDDEEDDDAKRRRTYHDLEEENNGQQEGFDISRVLPEPAPSPCNFDLLSVIQIPFIFDRELYIDSVINDAMMLSQKIVVFMQDIFTKNPLLFVNFITKFHYTNYIFTLTQIRKTARTSKNNDFKSITKELISVMKEDVVGIKQVPPPYFPTDSRQEYANMMQKMFDLLYSIL